MRSSADFASRACGSRLNSDSENLCKARDADLKILHGEALDKLRELPDESVQCCVTSPPFWGLRDYGTASWEGGDDGCDHLKVSPGTASIGKSTLGGGQATNGHQQEGFKANCGKCGAKRIDSQLGLEKTPEEYVAKMVEVFREVRRVLRNDGVCWINLGDSYAGGGKEISEKQGSNRGNRYEKKPVPNGLKPKDLCGIPWRVAFALQADGWYLRQDIIWAKPNPMPESVTDRCTKSHEYLFLLTKSARYFYDAEAIKEKASENTHSMGNGVGNKNPSIANDDHFQTRFQSPLAVQSSRNKRSVWTVATAPYPEAHFATYPPDLIKPCILAGTSAKGCCATCAGPWERVIEKEPNPKGILGGQHRKIYRDGGFERRGERDHEHEKHLGQFKTLGWKPTCQCAKVALNNGGFALKVELTATIPCTVLDPFAGSGTTGAVALELGRRAILIELNTKYIELIHRRCTITPGFAFA